MNSINAFRRQAGSKIVHTVSHRGEVVATRRSEHTYDYAICKRSYGSGSLVVKRWSNASRCAYGEFAVPVQSA